MQESFVIKYDFQAHEGFDLALIGSSFVGFDKVIKELLNHAGLTDKVEVRTTRVKQGSVEVLNTIVSLDPLFIQSPQHLIEFLKIAGPEFIKGVNSTLAATNSLNDYYKNKPVDFQIHFLVAAYIVKSIYIAGKTKLGDKAAIEATKASPRQIARLKRMVKRGYYKKALTPITEGNISKVELTAMSGSKKHTVAISDKNVGDFLPDDERILPQFNDGDRVNLSGELQLLGSTHGDSMKIKIRDIDPKNSLLDATLADGLDIINYRDLFKQTVFLMAEIRRKNMYKKPELVIHEMTPLQERLDLAFNDTNEPQEGHANIQVTNPEI